MTQITDKQQWVNATTSITAKLERFQESLSPEERVMLSAALRTAGAAPHAASADVAGYDYAIERAARAYVDSMPIWGGLQALVAAIARPPAT